MAFLLEGFYQRFFLIPRAKFGKSVRNEGRNFQLAVECELEVNCEIYALRLLEENVCSFVENWFVALGEMLSKVDVVTNR